MADDVPPTPPAKEASPTPESDDGLVRKPWLDWSDRDQRVLVGLAALVMLATGFHWAKWRWRGIDVVEIERLPERKYDFRIDINQATWVEWMQLPGIGELLARRIVADREERGPFRDVSEVNRVPGIGTVTFDTIQPWLVCSDCKISTTH